MSNPFTEFMMCIQYYAQMARVEVPNFAVFGMLLSEILLKAVDMI